MIEFEPIVYPQDHPGYQMALSLLALYDQDNRALASPPAIRLLARSPVSPVSKMIWSHLTSLSERGCTVEVIFHKRQHPGSARRAVQMYRDAFGDKAFDLVRLADFKEVGHMYEELQMGPTLAWSGARMSSDGAELKDGDASRDVSPGQLAMFETSWKELWRVSESFAVAAGVRDPRASRKFGRLLRAG